MFNSITFQPRRGIRTGINVLMKEKTNQCKELPQNSLPSKDIEFFYRITMWAQKFKETQIEGAKWKDVEKSCSLIQFIKPKSGEKLSIPDEIASGTMYLPLQSGSKTILRDIRNAFCHDALVYDAEKEEYLIEPNKHTKIAGKFTIKGIQEMIEAYFHSQGNKKTNQKNKK